MSIEAAIERLIKKEVKDQLAKQSEKRDNRKCKAWTEMEEEALRNLFLSFVHEASGMLGRTPNAIKARLEKMHHVGQLCDSSSYSNYR